MNNRALYLAIGEIDDELILDADRPAAGARRPSYLRWGALAACLLLAMAGLLFFRPGGDQVYFNSLTPPPSVTAKVQGEAELLSYQEAMDYYGIVLPDALGDLSRQEQALFAVCRQADGSVTWDENRVEYGQGDRRVTVALSKAVLPFPESGQGGKLSTLQGVSVMLSTADSQHWAQFQQKDVIFRVFSQGLNQDQFLDVVRAILST